MSCRAAEGLGGSRRGTAAATSTAARTGCCRRGCGRTISGATPTGSEMDRAPPLTVSASTCDAPAVAAVAAVAVAVVVVSAVAATSPTRRRAGHPPASTRLGGGCRRGTLGDGGGGLRGAARRLVASCMPSAARLFWPLGRRPARTRACQRGSFCCPLHWGGCPLVRGRGSGARGRRCCGMTLDLGVHPGSLLGGGMACRWARSVPRRWRRAAATVVAVVVGDGGGVVPAGLCVSSEALPLAAGMALFSR